MPRPKITSSYQVKAEVPPDATHCGRCTILVFEVVPAGWDVGFHQGKDGFCPECAAVVAAGARATVETTTMI